MWASLQVDRLSTNTQVEKKSQNNLAIIDKDLTSLPTLVLPAWNNQKHASKHLCRLLILIYEC